MDTLVEVRELWRYYGDRPALRGLSFALRRGEILGFLGPNGAGKSTTMQVIAGSLAPSSGTVSIQGLDVLEQARSAKACLGYLPEHPPLLRELTVDEYLGHCGRLRGLGGRRLRAAVERAKERCGLGDVGRRLIGNLSKGYQQRAGIAQAILHQPPVILLDEPTVGLDPLQIRAIRDLVRELGGEHGVILSTHILSEVQATCNRVQIIHQGALVLSDTIAGLAQRMEGDSLCVRFRAPPDPAELAAIPGVSRVDALDGGRLRVLCTAGRDPTEQLVARAVQGGWGLRELTPEQGSLEQIFVELTAEHMACE